MGAAETYYRDSIVHMVSGPRLIVAAWRDAPTLTQTDALWRINADVREWTGDDDVAFCNVAISGTPIFDAAVREQIQAMNREYGARGLAQANLVLLEGFAGTAVRAFLSTVNLVARTKVPVKIFGERRETERWLLEMLVTVEPAYDPAALTETFDRALGEAAVAAE
jgi:hypothetical protein